MDKQRRSAWYVDAREAAPELSIKCGVGHDLRVRDLQAVINAKPEDRVNLPCGCIKVTAGRIQTLIREAMRAAGMKI